MKNKKTTNKRKEQGVYDVKVYGDSHKWLKIEAAKEGITLLKFCERLIKEEKERRKLK